MKDVFRLTKSFNYNIRSSRTFISTSFKTVYYGTESLSNLAPKDWELNKTILNNIKSLENFPIKYWKPDVSPCRLCRLYIPQVGFVSGCSFNFHFYTY